MSLKYGAKRHPFLGTSSGSRPETALGPFSFALEPTKEKHHGTQKKGSHRQGSAREEGRPEARSPQGPEQEVDDQGVT